MYHGVIQDDGSSGDEQASAEPKAAKKERVLHTRIPAVLEQELKAAAKALRVPVSNLVRTILEDAVVAADRATERVEESLGQAAERLHDERARVRRAARA